MNPLAVFLANTKLLALKADVAKLLAYIFTPPYASFLCRKVRPPVATHGTSISRSGSRRKFFADLERLHCAIAQVEERSANILLQWPAGLVGDWSLQDPADLRHFR